MQATGRWRHGRGAPESRLPDPVVPRTPERRDPGGGHVLIRIDILDDRLEAIQADDDRERLRRYLGLWREGAIDPLRDPGVVLILELDDGPRPRRLVAHDGLGDGTAGGHLALAADASS